MTKHIHSLALTAICLFVSVCATAQRGNGNMNYLDFANKPYYFGITLGYVSSDFRIIQSERFIQHDSIKSVTPQFGPGFNLGIVTNLNVGKHFDFRLLPTLSFQERRLTYQMLSGAAVNRGIESVFVEMPFEVRYKSDPYHDVRLYVVAGMKYGFDVASNSRARQAEKLIKVAPSDFSVVYGAGFQIYLPYFILSPEFKVSNGIGNVLIYDTNLQQSSVLEQLYTRTFTFSLHFEG
jgi:hypothetical protein